LTKGAQFGENPYKQIDNVKNGYAVIEAEDAVLGSCASIADDDSASGGKYIRFSHSVAATAPEDMPLNPTVRFDFLIKKPAEYFIWLRVLTKTEGDNSAYISVDSSDFVNKGFKANLSWQWVNYGVRSFETGVHHLALKYREREFRIDKMIVTADSSFAPTLADSLPTEIPEADIPSQSTFSVEGIIKPIEGHPRVFLTAEHIEKLKEYVKTPELLPTWKSVMLSAEKNIVSLLPGSKTVDKNGNVTDTGSYSSSVLNSIQCRALLYAMGERDGEFARQTVEHARNYLATVTFNENANDITRQKGMVITMGAIVYDWCYDHMTEGDKRYFIKRFKEICAIKEIGYPPKANIVSTGGHMGEYEVHRDMLSAGIACYDEDPQLYDYASGILFNRFDDSRKLFNKSGNHPNGNDYGQFRISCEAYADFLYRRMYPEMEHIYGEEFGNLALRFLYARLPDGMIMKDGDSYSYSSRNAISVNDGTYMMYMMLGNLYSEPYARAEHLRQQSLGSYTKENFWTVLLSNPTQSPKHIHELPLSYVTTYPLTSVFARTAWQSGIDSDAAVCQMKTYERTVWDHMHADAGHFQLYYKGTLALDAGSYQGYDKVTGALLDYGSAHNYNYNKRSVAHNVVTVTDPSETFAGNENDGGQKRPVKGSVVEDYQTLMSDEALRAKTEGLYTGPNRMTPAFSYLKTDITSAYSSAKMELNVRSMVFMDLFADDYPAALVVFDRVVSKDAGFDKKWLLNSIQEPSVNGSLTTIVRDEHGYNGKLVNKTLLPEDFTITKVEGCTVNGTDYAINDKNPTDWHATEQGGWRIELMPKAESREDYFLNAMYVTDADGNKPLLEATKKESGSFVGVSIKDRLVMFSKSTSLQTSAFNLTVDSNGYNKVMCLIADVKPGVWNISGLNINAEVKEGENVLCFEASPGSYTFTPVSAEPTALSFEKQTKPQIGDFIIYFNDTAKDEQQHMNCTLANIERNGVAYVPVRTIFERMYLYSGGRCGAQLTSWDEAGAIATFTNGSGQSISLYDGMTSYSSDGKNINLEADVFTENGTMYASVKDFSGFLNLKSVLYDSLAMLLKLTA